MVVIWGGDFEPNLLNEFLAPFIGCMLLGIQNNCLAQPRKSSQNKIASTKGGLIS